MASWERNGKKEMERIMLSCFKQVNQHKDLFVIFFGIERLYFLKNKSWLLFSSVMLEVDMLYRIFFPFHLSNINFLPSAFIGHFNSA